MRVSEWLDQQEANHVDVSRIDLPTDVLYDDQPDEVLYFEEVNPCGIFCRENHPFATVERFAHWFCARGQDRSAGLHSPEGEWKLFTKSESLALKTAKSHMEQPGKAEGSEA